MPRRKVQRQRSSRAIVPAAPVERLIYLARGQRVIVDSDLAFLYGVTTKALNQQVRRNADRFPPDFMFQLTWEEAQSLRSQIVTLNDHPNLRSQIVTSSFPESPQLLPGQAVAPDSSRSQNVTLNGPDITQAQQTPSVTPDSSRSQNATLNRGTNIKYRPFAFTEHGAIMAATVLSSPQAVRVSVFVVRAFVKLREMLAAHRELSARIDELERNVQVKLQEHDGQILNLFEIIRGLLEEEEAPPKPPIGFQTELAGHLANPKATRRAPPRAKHPA
jgi:hypothetical protein